MRPSSSRPRSESSSWSRCSAIVRPTYRCPNSSAFRYWKCIVPCWVSAELLREHGVHRPPDDRALDLRAGVDPDDRGRVVDRVEVVLPRLALERLLAELRPDRSPAGRPSSTPGPLRPRCAGAAERSRPPRPRPRAAQRASQRRTNATSSRRDEARGADVEHDRLVRRRPTRAQNSSRERLGCHSNQWSYDQAPRTRTRSRGMSCSSRPRRPGSRSRRARPRGSRGRAPCS